MKPFRYYPEPEDPELALLGQWCQFKREQQRQRDIDSYLAPLRRQEQRRAEARRKAEEPFVQQRQALARRVFR